MGKSGLSDAGDARVDLSTRNIKRAAVRRLSLEGETMQTLYYTTGNFIRHTGNVVDLTEYRRRLAQTEQEAEEAEEKIVLLPREIEPSPRRTRARRARRRALFLDACASMGVVVMTLTFTLRMLAL